MSNFKLPNFAIILNFLILKHFKGPAFQNNRMPASQVAFRDLRETALWGHRTGYVYTNVHFTLHYTPLVTLHSFNFGVICELNLLLLCFSTVPLRVLGFVFCRSRIRFHLHVTVNLFSNTSQMTSKCGKRNKVPHEAIAECHYIHLKAHLQQTGIESRGTIFKYENPAKAEIYPIKSLR